MRPRLRRANPVCEACKHGFEVTYKKPQELRRYLNRAGRIMPRRLSRMCAKHQRRLNQEIKRARTMAMLPYQLEESVPIGGERQGRGGRRFSR